MSTFNFTEAPNSTGPYPGSADQQGYCSGIFAGGSACGTMNTGSPQLGTAQIEVITFVDSGGAGQISLCLDGTLTQSFFYEIQFTDHSGTPRTYLSSAALTFDTASEPGYSIWTWTSAASYPFNGGSFNGTITYSLTGPATVPNVIGDTVAAATTALTTAGLTLGTVTYDPNSGLTPGIVEYQQYVAGTILTAGTAVGLVVAGIGNLTVYGKFAPASVFPPIAFANEGLIEPRVWMPPENITVRT